MPACLLPYDAPLWQATKDWASRLLLDNKEFYMLYYALVFFLVALVAGLFGMFWLSAAAANIAYVLFVIFLILFIVSLIAGIGRRGKVA